MGNLYINYKIPLGNLNQFSIYILYYYYILLFFLIYSTVVLFKIINIDPGKPAAEVSQT